MLYLYFVFLHVCRVRVASAAVSLVTTDHHSLAHSAEAQVMSLLTLYLLKKKVLQPEKKTVGPENEMLR